MSLFSKHLRLGVMVFVFGVQATGAAEAMDASAANAALPLPQKVRDALDLARDVPAEFQAQALIVAGESAEVTDPSQKINLIEQGFAKAYSVANLLPSQPASSNRLAYHPAERFYVHMLDRLSLQEQAIDAMYDVDRERAIALFERVGALNIPPTSCDQAQVPDAVTYYRLAVKLIKPLPDPDRRAAMIRRLIDQAQAPEEVPYAMELVSLAGAKLSKEQLRPLIEAVNTMLNRVSGDDQGFSVEEGSLITHALNLLTFESANEIDHTDYKQAFRSYLVRHFTATRCRANYEDAKPHEAAWAAGDQLRRLALLPSEMTPSGFEGPERVGARPDDKSADYRDYMKTAKLAYDETNLMAAEKKLPADLTAKIDAQLSHIAQIKDSLQGRELTDAQKLQYHLLMVSTFRILQSPLTFSNFESPLAKKALSTMVDLVTKSPFYKEEDKLNWYLDVRGMFYMMHRQDKTIQDLVLPAIIESGNPIMKLEGTLERDVGSTSPMDRYLQHNDPRTNKNLIEDLKRGNDGDYLY
jgi:hypothetical protein